MRPVVEIAGVALDSSRLNVSGQPRSSGQYTRRSTTRRTGKVLNDDRADWREAWALFPGDVAYVWHAARHARRRRHRPGTAPRPHASPHGRHSAPCRCAWVALQHRRGSSRWAAATPYGGSVTIRCGAAPASSRATAAASVASPQSTRCGPSSQTSPEHPVSRPGDLWLLGPHRVLCGDATDAADGGAAARRRRRRI